MIPEEKTSLCNKRIIIRKFKEIGKSDQRNTTGRAGTGR